MRVEVMYTIQVHQTLPDTLIAPYHCDTRNWATQTYHLKQEELTTRANFLMVICQISLSLECDRCSHGYVFGSANKRTDFYSFQGPQIQISSHKQKVLSCIVYEALDRL
ncbi:hypothetical protein Plhal304r1_c052g0136811 [Plasmopara halstedii]